MAGRPAPSRGGGLSGVHYGLIAMVFVAVIALVLFVLQLTKVKDLEATAAQYDRLKKQVGSLPAYFADEASSRKTSVFSVVDRDMEAIGNLVTGKGREGSDPIYRPMIEQTAQRYLRNAVAREVDSLAAAGVADPRAEIQEEDALLTAIDKYSRAVSGLKVENLKLTADQRAAQEQNEALSGQISDVQQAFQQEVAALKAQYDERASGDAEGMALKDQQLEELQSELDARTQQLTQLQQQVRAQDLEKDRELARLKDQVAMLQEQVRDLKPGTADVDAILAKADGRVLRAIPGSDIVYISLGENQSLKIGMGFEVYSQSGESPQSLRGKASLEVVTVMADTAECRVTRATRGRPIIEGDAIVNIAYERNRRPKFVVRGEFDLDYDGVVDFDGVERVKAMIRDWGGQIVDQLDETTDFLIIGAAPHAPSFYEAEQISPQVAEQIRTQQLAASAFSDMIVRAQSTFIPVITQSQFLFMTGNTGT